MDPLETSANLAALIGTELQVFAFLLVLSQDMDLTEQFAKSRETYNIVRIITTTH